MLIVSKTETRESERGNEREASLGETEQED